MPQIPNSLIPQFIEFLEAYGYEERTIDVCDLKPTQSNYDQPKVLQKILDLVEKGETKIHKKFICTKTKYILDGHHTMLAWTMYKPNTKARCVVVNASPQELVDIAFRFLKKENKHSN